MKRIIVLVLGIIGIVVAGLVIIQFIKVPVVTENNPFRSLAGGRPLIIAHGGSKELFPENTMVAFNGSMNLGVDMLEMDVCLTKDNILITHHDLTIDHMTNGKGNVIDYTYEELKTFNFGYGFVDENGNRPYRDLYVPVTKLSDVFEKYPDILFNVELKDIGENGKKAAKELYSLIRKYSLEDQILVPSFSDESIEYFREITGHSVMTSSASKETKKFIYMHFAQIDNFARGIKYESMQLPLESSGIKLASKAIIDDAHRRNIAVHYWTVDDPETMKRLIEMGADGIITDRPEVMKKVLKEMGY